MFGSSTFAFKNIRRKADARDYPSRLEFGLKRGIVPPTALNNGEQVDLLLSAHHRARTTALARFDDLPTPFRVVAVDLVTATPVVLDRGSLARRMRATMSLPLIFPPVELDGRVLVDGGAMNNVPADVVRAMGADARRRRQRRRSLPTSRRRQLLDVRSGRRDARRDDARQHQAAHRGSRRRHRRAAQGIRIARLAAQRRADRRRIQGRRGDARSAAAAGGQRARE